MSRLLVVGLVLVALGCVKSEPTYNTTRPDTGGTPVAPVAVFPPADWTHKELAEHLAKKGVKFTVQPLPLLSREGRVAAAFIPDDTENTGAMVFLCADPTRAREEAGAMGKGAFSKGRFAFGYNRGIASIAGPEGADRAKEIHARNEAFLKILEAALK